MTQDEVIRMAVACQLLNTSNRVGIYSEALQAFAKLIADKEREACAEICDKHHKNPVHYTAPSEAKLIGVYIRARGKV